MVAPAGLGPGRGAAFGPGGYVCGLALSPHRIKPLLAVLGAAQAREALSARAHAPGGTVVTPAGTVVPSTGVIRIHHWARSGIRDVGIAFLEEAPQNLELPFTLSPAPTCLGTSG